MSKLQQDSSPWAKTELLILVVEYFILVNFVCFFTELVVKVLNRFSLLKHLQYKDKWNAGFCFLQRQKPVLPHQASCRYKQEDNSD